MKLFKRIAITVCAAVFVFALVPASSFAVDPVSASTMANALAQAITAYGASQGVSMTYDVISTDGIGEGVHDLWNQFKQDVNDNNVPTYDSLAVTVWSTLFTKVNNHVGINLADTTVGYLDAFWNWMLSGPAEMTKVDNQYYEWTVNPQTGEVDPILVYSVSPIPHQPIPSGITTSNLSQGYHYATWNNNTDLYVGTESNDGYVFIYGDGTSNILVCSPVSGTNFKYNTNYNTIVTHEANSLYNVNGVQFYYYNQSLTAITSVYCPTFTDRSSALSYFASVISGQVSSDSLSVQPYIGDATPQDVYIPDNDDVNYAPLPYVGELDIPWDDSLFGDGTGSLSDEQSQAITDDLSSVIEQDSTLTLAEDAPIVNPPSEVYIPLLPVTLPSFNFSFSGIWHYVVTWVGSLGSWITLMFSVWNSLPYAIVIPVYASAVVVIIIGTLKRFL